jgi:tetratricopeptide (TPR) repeat protein
MMDQLCNDYPDRIAHFYYIIGRRCQIQKKPSDAVAAFKQSLSISHASARSPEIKEINERLVSCYRYTGDYEEQRKQIELMINTYPEEIGHWKLYLGWCYLEARSYDKAILVLSEVIEKYPNFAATAQVSLVECFSRLGKGDEALAKLKDYYKDKPDLYPEYLFAYGQSLYYGLQDYERSISVLKQFISNYPNSPQILRAKTVLSLALRETGRNAEAADMLKGILTSSSLDTKPDTIYEIGQLYFKAKKYREAIEAFKNALQLPDIESDMQAEIMYHLGLCYHEMNYKDSSRRYMKIVIERWPDSDWAKKARGAIYVWDNYGAASKIENQE